MCSSGDVNVFKWNRECFFSRRVKFESGFNVMAVYEASLTWTKNHLSLHRHPEMSHDVVEETLLILQENLREFLLELDVPGIKVDVLSSWSPPGSLIRPSGDWKNKISSFIGKYHLFRIESFRVDVRCVHRLQLLKVCDQNVTLPNSPPRTKRIRGTIQVRLSFQIDGFLTGLSHR